MATYASAVQVFAQLSNSAVAAPAVGGSASGAFTFTDGDDSTDNIKLVATGRTALHAVASSAAVIFVSNPAFNAGVANTATILIESGSTVIGTLLPGMCLVMPVGASVQINGTASAAQNVGVTLVECSANA